MIAAKFSPRVIAFGLLFSLGLIWGSGYAIARYCVTHGVAPMGYSFWQSLGPAMLLWLTLRVRDRTLSFNRKQLEYYFICGILGIAFPNTLMYFAAQHLPSGLLAVLVNTVPLITYPLALLLRQEVFKWGRLAGVILGLLGIMLIIWPKVGAQPMSHWSWLLVVLLTPLSFALCAIFIASTQPQQHDVLSLSAGMLLTSALLLSPLTLLTGEFQPLWSWKLVNGLIFLEILLSSVGYVLFFYLLKYAGPVYYSVVGSIVSLTGLFWGWLVFDERLTVLNLIAIACIFAGITLTTWWLKAYRKKEYSWQE